MARPVAGVEIAFLCVVVILGSKNPLVVDPNCKIEDASGTTFPPM
jgi:hypothetical protein